MLEKFFNSSYQHSWVSVPNEAYNIQEECDLACSQECLSLLDVNAGLKVIDSCNAQRCGCFYSQVDSNLCTPSCKKSCILVGGGKEELDECLTNSCECSSQVEWALTQIHEAKPKEHHQRNSRREEVRHDAILVLSNTSSASVENSTSTEKDMINEDDTTEAIELDL